MLTHNSRPDFQFDADTHTYRVDGSVLPSVTQIISSVLPGFQAGDWYLNRGRALHLACAHDDRGILIEESVHEEIAQRLKAWRKFKADTGALITMIEKPLWSAQYRFAGTVDRALTFNGKTLFGYREVPAWTLCDLKSTISPQVVVQLGGYNLLLREAGVAIGQGVAVELRDSGDYRCQWFDKAELRRGEQTFLAALTIHNFRVKHGLDKPRSVAGME